MGARRNSAAIFNFENGGNKYLESKNDPNSFPNITILYETMEILPLSMEHCVMCSMESSSVWAIQDL